MNAAGRSVIRFMAFLMIMLAYGCTDDEIWFPASYPEGGYHLMLSVSSRSLTRAGDRPFGGEDGDGREYGRNFENVISDVTLFVYHADGVGADMTTEVKYSIYVDGLNLSLVEGTVYSLPILVADYEPDEGDRIIVLANMGDRTDLVTLGQVRDAAVTQAWTPDTDGDIRHYRHFAMSSAVDQGDIGRVVVAGRTGAYNDPFCADVTLERVAARFDIWLIRQSASVGAPVEYEAKDGSGTLRLSHIRLVNASEKPAYTLKRTASSVNPLGSVTYLGDETVLSGTHIPSNYVVEPLTVQKNATSPVSDETLRNWYGGSALEYSLSPSFLSSDDYRIHGHASDEMVFTVNESEDVDGDGYPEGDMLCYTLGYAMENTMDITGQQHRFMTGLSIKGTFVPVTVYTMSGTVAVSDDSYEAGSDIWLYRNLDSPELSRYFSSEEAVHRFEASQPAVTHSIIYYKDAECYYYVWIRHAMFDAPLHPAGTYPMEYGTVRNNIYRIGVESVSTIGAPFPDPESEESALHSRLYVRKWRFREENEIVL